MNTDEGLRDRDESAPAESSDADATEAPEDDAEAPRTTRVKGTAAPSRAGGTATTRRSRR